MPRGVPTAAMAATAATCCCRTASTATPSTTEGKRLFKAGNGGPGDANNRFGRRGDDLLIELPVGTI